LATIHLELGFEKQIHELERRLSERESKANPTPEEREEIRGLRAQIQHELRELYGNLDPSSIVKVARHSARPQTLDYIELIFDEFVELHGDRCFGDDRAIVTGFAKLEDQKVLLVGQHKGRTIKERNECYFGCAHPEGYRKALQKMQLAAKFRLPIICLIDTPGAYPGIGAEERGQASSIAVNLRELSVLRTPIVCVVIGEGGSGGALGIGIGDHVAMLEFSYYSVISPEGCAGILWKDGRRADQAARALKFTSADLKRMQIVDEVIREPPGGAHRDHRAMAATLKHSLIQALGRLSVVPTETLLARRYQKFRRIGAYEEQALEAAEKSRPPVASGDGPPKTDGPGKTDGPLKTDGPAKPSPNRSSAKNGPKNGPAKNNGK
jgi:acetyl-CoA carboxylase carboxyl transferase subunit alpha